MNIININNSCFNLDDIEQLVVGMAHRGRLNLMICLLKLDPCLLFTKVLFLKS